MHELAPGIDFRLLPCAGAAAAGAAGHYVPLLAWPTTLRLDFHCHSKAGWQRWLPLEVWVCDTEPCLPGPKRAASFTGPSYRFAFEQLPLTRFMQVTYKCNIFPD